MSTSPFFDGRTIVTAESLTGPRVYSTDLLPTLYDLGKLDESAAIAARALKIKILTKGLVTLNCAYLVSPVAVRLMELHPDLLDGNSILPAFRTDKPNLDSLVASSAADHAAAAIDESRLGRHIGLLEGKLKRVLPWDLSGVGETYRNAVVSGLRNPGSLIGREVVGTGQATREGLEEIACEIEALDFTDSVNLREYIAKLPDNVREPLRRYTTACYHRVGTGVVRCETGMDLAPLSDFKAADLVLAGRAGATLSDESIFLELFLAFALDTIQAGALPTQIIDAISFETAHKLGDALRFQGFQERYDEITAQYAASKANDNARETLESLDVEKIAAIAAGLAAEFRRVVLDELPDYETKIHGDAKEALYCTGGDIFKEGLAGVPVLGNAVAWANAAKHLSDLTQELSDLATTRDQNAAFLLAKKRRIEDIYGAIDDLRTSAGFKAKLLNAVAVLSDVHGITIRRA